MVVDHGELGKKTRVNLYLSLLLGLVLPYKFLLEKTTAELLFFIILILLEV